MTRPRGGIIAGTLPAWTTTSTSGVFALREAQELRAANTWPRGPAAPTSLTATAGNAQLSLSWTAPATTHGTITNYLVEYTASGGSPQYVLTGSTSTSYTLTGLTNGTAYAVRVAAVNFTAGDYSGTQTATPIAMEVPGAVQNLSASIVCCSPTGGLYPRVSWLPPSSDGGAAITGYRYIAVGDVTNENVVIAGTTRNSFSTNCNGNATITVRAINSVGEGPPTTITTPTWNFCD